MGARSHRRACRNTGGQPQTRAPGSLTAGGFPSPSPIRELHVCQQPLTGLAGSLVCGPCLYGPCFMDPASATILTGVMGCAFLRARGVCSSQLSLLKLPHPYETQSSRNSLQPPAQHTLLPICKLLAPVLPWPYICS